MRTCIVCHGLLPQTSLLRLGALGDRVQVAPKASGRGAHVCVERACLKKLDKKVLSHAFRQPMHCIDLGDIHLLAQKRVLETIGLARRQGDLQVGVDQVLRSSPFSAEGQHDNENRAVIVASDLAERSLRRAQDADIFIDAATLGQAAGMGRVGAMKIRSRRLGKQASFWLHVWHATFPSTQPGKTQGVQHG